MLDVESALNNCFDELSMEYDIKKVDSIPMIENIPKICIWEIRIPALLLGKAEDVVIYMLFPDDFPYSMPWVIIHDDRFKYLPHISVKSRKLCIYEDEDVYDLSNINGLVRDNIDKTRRWVEKYYGRDNSDEYAKEIWNYWNEQYDGETILNDTWLLLGDIPTETCEMVGIVYSNGNLKNKYIVVTSDKENKTLTYIKHKYKINDIPVLYIASLKNSNVPPLSMTGEELIARIENENDKNVFKRLLNHYGRLNVLFSIGLTYAVGGVCIDELKVNRNGYRKGMLKPYKVLTSFENKNRKLKRLCISVYSEHRIAERTAGEMMKERHFLIGGLGSVGSNLCYYLNGYNNAVFSLIDRDCLTVDNIGRHLLGFIYINQYKSYAVARYLKQYRPDREVNAMIKKIQQLDDEYINKASAIFVCTGNVMSEKWLLDKIIEGSVRKPSFILWLEPYGISGVMIYINPENKESVKKIKEKANDSFMDYCLIKREEYAKNKKLIQHNVGCNGNYALYSANDVTMFLSVMFPIIDQLLENGLESKCYRWVGNIEIAAKKGISLVSSSGLSKNILQELPI